MLRRLTLIAVVLLIGTFALPAIAKAPDAYGWWWVHQRQETTVAIGTRVDTPYPPNVPEDGLYIGSEPANGAEAIAALRYDVPEGANGQTLVLRVAGDIVGEPVLGICRAAPGWGPAQAGMWTQRPEFDCGISSPGTLSEDATTVTFDATKLVSGRVLNVVVVPGKDASGRDPLFRIAFNRPGDDSLSSSVATDPPTEPASPEPAESEPPATPPSGKTGAGAPSGGASFDPVTVPNEPPALVAAPAGTAFNLGAPGTGGAAPVIAQQGGERAGGGLQPGVVFALIGLIVVANIAIVLARQRQAPPTELVDLSRYRGSSLAPAPTDAVTTQDQEMGRS